MRHFRGFVSDNNSGVHPDIMDAIISANRGHTIAYGDDKYTKSAINKFKEYFGKEIDVYFVFNGTAANVLGIDAFIMPFNSIICAETAHLNLDECGAPERFTGSKLLTLPTKNGKININQINKYLHYSEDEHRSQPRVVSITQATEYGTVYQLDEIKEIADFAHKNDLILHMDGARLANAAVYLKTDLNTITKDAGVDVLSFGGTKNGIMYGEAIIFFNHSYSYDFKYIRKQGMQLASKMRFIAVQFEAYLSNNLWKKNAVNANKMAKYLEEKIRAFSEIRITQKVEANEIFVSIPEKYLKELQNEYDIMIWDEDKSEVRLVTSFDTTKADVDDFVKTMKELFR